MRLRVALLLLVLCPVGTAAAEPGPASHAGGALPGVYRVTTAEPDPLGLGFYTGAGYGFASSVMGADDTHHRAAGTLAASYAPVPWLALGLRLDGRYDRHAGLAGITGGEDIDDGLVGEPRLLALARGSLNDAWHAGARLTVWAPGSDAPSVIASAVTVDGVAALTYAAPDQPLRVGVNAGFRLDRSARSADDAALLSQADRLSLGVSDASAVLVGAGATYRLGAVTLLGEWTWDLLIGDQAPPLRTSPMRVAAGLRAALTGTLAVELVAESNLARLPTAAPGEPLVPYEPRLSVIAGLHYRFGGAPAPARPEDPDGQPEAPRPGEIHGQVREAGGAAVPAATVEIAAGDARRRATVSPEGAFHVEDVASGPVEVTVRAEGFEPVTRALTLAPGRAQELDIVLERALPPGQIRGFVRSFGGKPLPAALTIEPLGTSVTAGADGGFEIDVAPGEYEVVIRAPGYREQRRSVTVEEGGVLILNVDLRRAR